MSDADRLFVSVRLSLSIVSSLDSLVGVTKTTPGFCEGSHFQHMVVLVVKIDDSEGRLGGSVS